MLKQSLNHIDDKRRGKFSCCGDSYQVSNCFVCVRFIVILFVMITSLCYSQSNETGVVFNKFSNAESGINMLSGTAAFKKNLVTIFAGNISTSLELNYSSNVSEVVKNKNDIAPTSWVGLGWSLGHAKITSDNAGTMWAGDDTFYLETSAGVRYKIFKDSAGKWWVEGLPYWKLEPKLKTVVFNNSEGIKKYEIITGWLIVDDAGSKYQYGDMDYDSLAPTRNATEYVQANPYSNGIVGVYENGHDVCYPSVWNLRKIEDIDKNYIEFNYEQFIEKVAKNYKTEVYRNMDSQTLTEWKSIPYITRTAYTKETYLKSIISSNGSFVEITTKLKNYKDEFLDLKGDTEIEFSDKPDAFVDPLQRRYLSQIAVYGTDGKILKYIDFCYKSLGIKIDGIENPHYTKRLLTSIEEIAVNKNHSEQIQKESYSYYESDFDNKKNVHLPLGAIDSIKGTDCGVVKYLYKEYALSNLDKSTGMHKDEVPLVNISMGTLEDGTPYIVGLNKLKKNEQVYFRRKGTWIYGESLNVDYGDKGHFMIGGNWFVYQTSNENGTYYPFIWDGKTWKKGESFTDYGSHDIATVGPGYLLSAHIANHKIKLKMIWSTWGSTFEKTISSVDDDDDDRKYINLFTSRNHFGIFYKNANDVGNSGHLKIYSFDNSKNVIETYDKDDLDDDNKYGFMDDNILVAVTESKGITGFYAKAYHWRESDDASGFWYEYNITKMNGWQGVSSIQAIGDMYFVAKHNDFDDMSLFEYDGEKWNVVYDNENMVHHQDFDPKTEAEWEGVPGYNFFVAVRPRIKKHWYGNEIKANREYKRYAKINGNWEEGKNYSSGDKKHVYAGNNWYIIKERQYGNVYNGNEWVEEHYDTLPSGKPSNFLTCSECEITTLNGDYLIEESYYNTRIYYKKSDSFNKNFYGFFVSEKHVKEPIADKITVYKYGYSPRIANESNTPFYDYTLKSPVIQGYTITLPENAGTIEKILCNYVGEKQGVATGEICKENYYESFHDIKPSQSVVREYERYKSESWPGFIYSDRIKEVITKVDNLTKVETYTYANDLNGSVSSIVVKDENTGKNLSERKNIYAVEKYSGLKNSNRISEKVAEYSCVPDCKTGTIVNAKINTYSKEFDDILRIKENWEYVPQGNKRDAKLTFNWSSTTQNKNWNRASKINRYQNGVVTEIQNVLGIKQSTIYDKGPSMRALAFITNAGIDEILIMPGDTCGVNAWLECENKELVGRSLENKGDNLPQSYGRFSKNVVQITSKKSLKGSIKKAKKEKYRFSTWVQGTGKQETLDISVGTYKQSFDLKGSGTWEYLEWETENLLSSNSYTLSISTQSDTEIHLQDVRFTPIGANVNVVFWDKHLNKPIAKVNDRGVAKYTEYDAIGRVTKTYNESADGKIILASKNTYQRGTCAVLTDYNKSLKELIVNGNSLSINSNPGTLEFYVSNNTDELEVSWKPIVDGEKVFYKIYADGENPDFKEDCCNGSETIMKNFKGNKMIIEVAVSTTSNPYKVIINKSTIGWVDYGHILTEGYNPTYVSDKKVDKLFYLTKEGVREAKFSANNWKDFENEKRTNQFNELVSTSGGMFDYVIALPDYVGMYDEKNIRSYSYNALGYSITSSGWSNENFFYKEGSKGYDYRIASSNNDIYVIHKKKSYYTKKNTNVGGDSLLGEQHSLVAWVNKNGIWNNLGKISDSIVTDADVSVGANNIPYVAYIGTTPSRKKTVKLFEPDLIDNEIDEEESIQSENLPNGIFESYEDYSQVVVIKHKNAEGWTGFESINGDILVDKNGNDVLNAQKIKLASDGENLYLAVLQKKNEEDKKMSLCVYKLIMENNAMAFVELTDTSYHSNVIAYLDKDNYFDLTVYQNRPYLSFANHANKNKLTVLSYKEKKWRSIGKPGFATISSKKESANLSVCNGIPFVVFKESSNSFNTKRRNKIVPMKYSVNDDKDLSIISMGNKIQSILSNSFRQYILNYEGRVSKDIDSLELNISLKNPNDVSGVSIQNNGEESFVWNKPLQGFFTMNKRIESNSVPKMKVSLSNGMNEIKVIVYGKGVAPLTYTMVIYREYIPELSLGVTLLGTEIGRIELSSSSSNMHSNISSSSIKNTLVYKVNADINDTASVKNICIEHSSSWFMYLSGELFSKNICLDYDFKENAFILSSSSRNEDVGYSSSQFSDNAGSKNKIVFVNQGGDSTILEIYTDKLSSSSYTAQSSNSEIINSSSSSFDEHDGLIPGTSIPKVYQLLYGTNLLGTNNITFSNSVSISVGYYVTKTSELAADANLQGTLMCSGDVSLSSRAYVNSIVTEGDYHSQSGAAYGSLVQNKVDIPSIPILQWSSGFENINIWAGQTKLFSPGLYGDVKIYSNTKVIFEPGSYYFKSLYIAPDAEITFNNSTQPLQLFVQNEFSLGDRTKIESLGGSSKLLLYGNGVSEMYLGVNSQISATVIYPNGKVNIAPHSEFTGTIWAKSINVGANAVVR